MTPSTKSTLSTPESAADDPPHPKPARLRSPIPWYGGKGRERTIIVPILERIPHHIYVEPFGGGASILLAKKPAPVEVYNDIHHDLTGFFRILADPRSFARFYRRVALLPHSRALYNDARAEYAAEADPVRRAALWFIVAATSFGGQLGRSWGYGISRSNRGMAHQVCAWLGKLERLPALHQRLQRVQFDCRDWRAGLSTYDTPETLFYLDPPFPRAVLRHECPYPTLSDADHADLVARALRLQAAVALSGYPTPLYDPLAAAGWRRITWRTCCSAAGRTRHSPIHGPGSALRLQPRVENLWLNPRAAAGQPRSCIPRARRHR